MNLIDRRGELLAELFLQDLQPEFIAKPSTDLGYDLFVGFRNSKAGLNVIAVEVKSTEKMVRDRIQVKKSLYDRWSNSNIPVLLLIVNVKDNKLFYHWPTPEISRESQSLVTLTVQATEIDEANRKQLRDRLAN
jgi:hypothetical protein